MPVYNRDVARILNQLADLLEIEGADAFRVRAYRNAARTLTTPSREVATMVQEGEDLTQLQGIGKAISEKIEEIVRTGTLSQLAEIEERTPAELSDLLDIPGLGPKRVQALHEELGIDTLDDLREAIQQGRVRTVSGLGAKTAERIEHELEQLQGEERRTRIDVAEEIVTPLLDYLRAIEGVEQVAVSGSYRRRQETVGDLDLLATGADGERIIQRFTEYEDVREVLSQGETRSTVRLRPDMQVDLRVVADESYGAALLYFSGSKDHVIALRNMALDQELKINEYGVFRDDERIAGATEEEIYALFDLPYIVPELREHRGELEAAAQGKLPELVTVDDLRGDLQTHTTASDGKSTLEEMAHAAQERGYAYLAITDHSPHVSVTQGLDAEALARRIDEIDALNETFDGFRVLKGIEVDILRDGSLDLPDDILRRLDIVVVSVHSAFDLERDKQTERIIRALDNPTANVLVHPTGRRLGERNPRKRPPYEVDMERVMKAALERGCFLEINASPDRLDLNDSYAKMAGELGLKLAISTDAHHTGELANIRFGVDQARRGWLTAEDIINTRSWRELKKLLKR
jgi:DNA polymerase (family X)